MTKQTPEENRRIAGGRHLDYITALDILTTRPDRSIVKAVIKNQAVESEIVLRALDIFAEDCDYVIDAALTRGDLTEQIITIIYKTMKSGWSSSQWRDQQLVFVKHPMCQTEHAWALLRSPHRDVRNQALNVFLGKSRFEPYVVNSIIQSLRDPDAEESVRDAAISLMRGAPEKLGDSCDSEQAMWLARFYSVLYSRGILNSADFFGRFMETADDLDPTFIKNLHVDKKLPVTLFQFIARKRNINYELSEIILENGSRSDIATLARNESPYIDRTRRLIFDGGHTAAMVALLESPQTDPAIVNDIIKSIVSGTRSTKSLQLLDAVLRRPELSDGNVSLVIAKAVEISAHKAMMSCVQRRDLTKEQVDMMVRYCRGDGKKELTKPMLDFITDGLLRFSNFFSEEDYASFILEFLANNEASDITGHSHLEGPRMIQLIDLFYKTGRLNKVITLARMYMVKDPDVWARLKAIATELKTKNLAIAIAVNPASDSSETAQGFLTIGGGNMIHKAYFGRGQEPSDEIKALIKGITRSKSILKKT